MTSPDPLDAASADLSSLQERPVVEHPDTLERVHRSLVAELEALAGGPRTEPPPDA